MGIACVRNMERKLNYQPLLVSGVMSIGRSLNIGLVVLAGILVWDTVTPSFAGASSAWLVAQEDLASPPNSAYPEQPLPPDGSEAPTSPAAERKPLTGGVEQNDLPGGANSGHLTGGATGNDWSGTGLPGQMGQPPANGLSGGTGQTGLTSGISADPDANDQELMINWDIWRNTLMQAIQNGTLAKINVPSEVHFVWDPTRQMMVSRYANGTSAWYALDVLPDRRIINVRLTKVSGYPSYDQAVLQAIYDLQGNSILAYPAGSKRKLVTQEASVRTAGQSQSNTYQMNDVETQHYRNGPR